jgi:hypothetical protein
VPAASFRNFRRASVMTILTLRATGASRTFNSPWRLKT